MLPASLKRTKNLAQAWGLMGSGFKSKKNRVGWVDDIEHLEVNEVKEGGGHLFKNIFGEEKFWRSLIQSLWQFMWPAEVGNLSAQSLRWPSWDSLKCHGVALSGRWIAGVREEQQEEQQEQEKEQEQPRDPLAKVAAPKAATECAYCLLPGSKPLYAQTKSLEPTMNQNDTPPEINHKKQTTSNKHHPKQTQIISKKGIYNKTIAKQKSKAHFKN